jgi:hypothetical protein
MEPGHMNDTATKLVSVGCKLPHGIHLDMKAQDGSLQRVTLKGANDARIVGGYGITENVSAEFMTAWLKKNARHAAVVNQSIFLHNDTRSAESMAKERRDIPTGLEGIDPVKTGMLKGANGENDADALKAYNKARAENPDRNRQRVE